MYIHLLSLSTYEPHPRAQDPMLKFPCALPRKEVHLDFQILDDMIHIMSKEMGDEEDRLPDHLMGWQWTTGRLCVVSFPLKEARLTFRCSSPSPTCLSNHL